tara:strand:+ start:240 stop:1445 length:1206 start_codon:yes stop_codon:yes gene_type:complete
VKFDNKRKIGALFLIVLAVITAFLPMALHLFFPALPSVKSEFEVAEATVNLTVSIPLFVMAFTSLIYGALSDHFGRRPILLGAIFLFIVGSTISAIAGNIWILILGRVIQAAGAGGSLGLARTIARDVFGADRLVKAMSYLTIAYTLGPMISAPIGGALVDMYNWRAVPVVAALFGIIMGFVCILVMFETHTKRKKNPQTYNPFFDFLALFKKIRFTSYVLQSGFSTAIFFTMATASSFLMIEYLERPASEYGLLFICFPAGFLVGSLISNRLSGVVSIEVMVLMGSFVMATGAVTQSAFLLLGIVTPLSIFLPGFIAISGQGIALPNAQAGAINVVGSLAGTAAGIGAFCQLFAAALSTQIFGLFADGTPFPMAIVVTAISVAVVIVGYIPFSLRKRDPD